MFPENCFCTLKEIKVGSHEFSRNQKIVNWKIVILGILNPRACKWCWETQLTRIPRWNFWTRIWNFSIKVEGEKLLMLSEM